MPPDDLRYFKIQFLDRSPQTFCLAGDGDIFSPCSVFLHASGFSAFGVNAWYIERDLHHCGIFMCKKSPLCMCVYVCVFVAAVGL